MAKLDTKKLLETYKFKQEKDDPRYLDTPDPNFPEPVKRFKLVSESFGSSVEEPYFWILNTLKEKMQYMDIVKIKDVFTATETSSFFGLTGQRLQIQQAQAMGYLAQIGKFVKELFGMIRELKTIDMRLEMYRESSKIYRDEKLEKSEGIKFERPESHSAEVALKNLWNELVEGGSRNPSSIFGLAQQIGFTTLPDLFFSNPTKSTKDIDQEVDKLEFNEKVKNVLKSKLYSYFTWKEQSFKEYVNRRNFMIKYLRQHYEIIKTYMNWVRPYLLHSKRLANDEARLRSAEIVGSFEQSMIEVEFLAKRKGKPYNRCILVNFLYTTRPALEFHRGEARQHAGAIHVGKVEITMRGYAWTNEEVKNFQKMRDDEDLELLGSVDSSIQAAMDMLKDDLKKYLKEAGKEVFKEDEVPKEEEEDEKDKIVFPNILDPFISVGKGFAELAGFELNKSDKKKEKPKTIEELKKEESDKKKAETDLKIAMFNLYNIFKKAHGMPSF